MVTLFRLNALGHAALCLVLLPAALIYGFVMSRPRYVGACIHCRHGAWSIVTDGQEFAISIERGTTCVGGVVYLAWREPGASRPCSIFLFPDSAPSEQLRRLRLCLALRR